MTQEEKELLLKDLCARLPYGVKIYFGGIPKLLTSITIETGYIEILVEGEYGKAAYCDFISTYNNTEYLQEEITEKCKPYLRSMSSMTEEERKEYKHLVAFSGSPDGAANFVDWLNKKMFAYHTIDGKDMFELGLALEAPDGMYD